MFFCIFIRQFGARRRRFLKMGARKNFISVSLILLRNASRMVQCIIDRLRFGELPIYESSENVALHFGCFIRLFGTGAGRADIYLMRRNYVRIDSRGCSRI